MLRVILSTLIMMFCINMVGCGNKAKNDTPDEWIKNNHDIFVVAMSNEIIMNSLSVTWDFWQRIGRLPDGLNVIKPSVSKMIEKIEEDKQNNNETVVIQKQVVKLLKEQKRRADSFYKGQDIQATGTLKRMVDGNNIMRKNIDTWDLMIEGGRCVNNPSVREMYMSRIINGIKINIQTESFLGIHWDKLIEEQPINFKFKIAADWSLIYECTEAEKLKLDEVLPLDKITVEETQFNTKNKVLKEVYIHTRGDHDVIKQYLTSKYGTPIKGRYYDIWEAGNFAISYDVDCDNCGRMYVRTKEYQDYLATCNW